MSKKSKQASNTRILLLDAIEVPDSIRHSLAYIDRFKNSTIEAPTLPRSPFPPSKHNTISSPAHFSACSEETQLSYGEAEEYEEMKSFSMKQRQDPYANNASLARKHTKGEEEYETVQNRHNSSEFSQRNADPQSSTPDEAQRKEKKKLAMQYLRLLGTRLAALRKPNRPRRKLAREHRQRYNTWDESSKQEKDPLYEGFFSAYERLSQKKEAMKHS